MAVEAPLVLFEIAIDGTILTSVGAGRSALGRVSTPGDNLFDLYAGIPEVLDSFNRARAGEAFTATSRVPGKEGEVIFETTYLPIHEGGDVRSVRGVALDITARVRAQEASELARREAAEHAAEAGEFARMLHVLADRLQSERENERSRVARDVHDDLGQALTALRFEVSWLRSQLGNHGPLNRKALLVRLADLDALIIGATRSVQSIAAGLRPPALDLVGLVGALEGEAAKFESRTGVGCRVTSGLSSDLESAISEGATVSLFRAVQEALTNVARHAKADFVEVRILDAGGGVAVEVEDDGQGFDEDGARDGALGLLGIRERVAALRGTFEVSSEPGGGTVLRVVLPPSVMSGRVPGLSPRGGLQERVA